MKRLTLCLLLSLTLTLTACFGSFRATRILYGWNKNVSSNGVLQSLVMIGLLIIPVYEVFGLADILVVNTIEFWGEDGPSGEKLGKALSVDSDTIAVDRADGRFVVRRKSPGNFEITLDGELIGDASVTPDGLALRDFRRARTFYLDRGELSTVTGKISQRLDAERGI